MKTLFLYTYVRISKLDKVAQPRRSAIGSLSWGVIRTYITFYFPVERNVSIKRGQARFILLSPSIMLMSDTNL